MMRTMMSTMTTTEQETAVKVCGVAPADKNPTYGPKPLL